jgi:hypothetical protein
MAALTVRGVAGVLLATEPASRRFGELNTRRLVAVTDLAATVATALHEHAERHDRSVAGWVERFVYESTATAGVARGSGPEFVIFHALMTAVRSGVGLAQPRPGLQRVAGAANEALVAWTTGNQVQVGFEACMRQAKSLTASTVDVVRDRSEVHELRVQHRAFVHDGIAQVLAAALSGDVPDRDLRLWLDRERVRVQAVIGVSSVGRSGDLASALPELREEFGRRGIYVLTETSDLPAWLTAVGGSLVEIIREALNNVVKHCDEPNAWCGVLQQDDGSVLIRITDYGTNFPVFRPGSGTGTATMISLAEQINSTIEWFQTATGGTEVKLVVTELTPN